MSFIKRYLRIIISFVFIIVMSILSFNCSKFDDWSWFQKIFQAPFYELTLLLNNILDFRSAYTISSITGLLLVFPIFKFAACSFVKQFNVLKEVKKIQNEKTNNDEEKVEKVSKMLDYYEKNGLSFFEILYIICFIFVGSYFLHFMLSGAFNENMFSITSLKILWFSLNKPDKMYILPSICLVFMYLIPTILFFIGKNGHSIDVKAKLIFRLLVRYSCETLILVPIFNSSIFAIFVILLNVFCYCKQLINENKGGVQNEPIREA